MAEASKKELCLWLVTPDRGQVRRVRLSRRLMAVAGVAAVLGVGLTFYIFGDYARVLINHTDAVYAVKELASEVDALKDERAKLEEQIGALKLESERAVAFKSDVNELMDEFYSVVESSTGLGLLKEEKKSSPAVPASKPSEKRIAQDSKREGIEALKKINKGLGGAEIDCTPDSLGHVHCGTNVSKNNISLIEDPAGEEEGSLFGGRSLYTADRDLLKARLDRYTQILRVLPIGSPTVEGEITSGFGYRTSPFSGRAALHEGIDLSIDSGSKVQSTGDGLVVKVDYDGTYGWMIDIQHTDNVVTRYAHLKKTLVKEGQAITRGDIIAYSGSTGRSTGPHVHYEVRVNGRAKNPMPFIALAEKLERFVS